VPGHQIAGKTGTTQDNVSVTFVGYTPGIAASAMVFNPKKAKDVGGFGGGKGATIWHDAMAPILDARGSANFPPADPVVANGNTRGVPGCLSVQQCRSALAAAGFKSATVRTDSARPQGSLVGTSPAQGGRAVAGQLVTILVSNGTGTAAPPAASPKTPVTPKNPGTQATPGSPRAPETPKTPATESPSPDPDPAPEPEPDPVPPDPTTP